MCFSPVGQRLTRERQRHHPLESHRSKQVICPVEVCESMPDHMKRRNQRPKPGEKVILKRLPPGFIDDLPEEDQRAISAVVGKPILLNKYERDGRAELEFRDDEGVDHFIYVDPKFIEPQ